MIRRAILLQVLFFVFNTIYAVSPIANFATKQQTGFTENKGQIVDQNRKQNKDVLFLLNGNGLNVQIRKGGFSYDTYTIERKLREDIAGLPLSQDEKLKMDSFSYAYKFHRIDLDFIGSNANLEFEPTEPAADYINYYNVETKPEGIFGVKNFKKIIVRNLYDGIDLEYLLDDKIGFKYNLIIHAGADIQKIKIQCKGANFELKENSLVWKLPNGDLQEKIPLSWYDDKQENRVQILYKKIATDIFGFSCEEKNNVYETLTIDPNPYRVWGDYFGGPGTERFCNIKTASTGSIYLAGTTTSTTNIATGGSYQSIYNANYDFFILQMGPLGARGWCTYYGGVDTENSPKIAIDGVGNPILVGYTSSSSNLGTNVGSYQINKAGVIDLIIAKFLNTGVLSWATYYGGDGIETDPSICLDNSGNILVSGTTSLSTSGICTVGAHQQINSGNDDAFLVKFSSIGQRLWATYYGGENYDNNSDVAVDPSGNVYLTFKTNSVSNISTSGASQISLNTSSDLALVKFNLNGFRQWGTYYGGNNLEDQPKVAVDASGNIYLTGASNSTTGISTAGSNQVNIAGGFDCILAKFSTLGAKLWATYVGGENSDSRPQIGLDNIGNVFILFETGSSVGISTTNVYQTLISIPSDLALLKFSSAGAKLFGTYYGGYGGQFESSLSIGASNEINLAAYTDANGNSFASTAGAYKSSTLGDDLFITQFKECVNALGSIGTIAGVGGNNICLGSSKTYSLSTSTLNASSYLWTVPAGWTITSGQGTTTVNVIPSGAGIISVKAYNICNDSTATASLSVTANTTATPSAISGSANPCFGVASPYSVTAVAGNTYEWILPSGWGGSSTTNSISVSSLPTTATGGDSIFVRAINTTTSCPSVYVKKRVDALRAPVAPTVVTGPNPACKTVATVFTSDSLPFANTYTWTFPSGWTIGTPSTNRQITVTPTASAVAGNVTVKGNNTVCGAGPIYTQALLAPVVTPASPGVVTGPSNVCSGTVQTYTSSTVAGVNYYRWSVPADWTISSGQGTVTVTVQVGNTSGNISVVAATNSGNSCESAPKTYAVAVNFTPLATTSITGPAEVCINGSYQFTCATVLNTAGYNWIIPSGYSIASGSNTNSIYLNTPATVSASIQIGVTAYNGACASPVTNFTFAGNNNLPVQPNPIVGNSVLCANSVQSYSVPAVASATSYTWTYPSTWYANGASNQNNISLTAGTVTGTISVKANNGACTSIARTFNVTNVNPSPNTPGLITYSGMNCSGKTNTLSIAAVSGATSYVWTLPSAWSGSSTSNSILVTLGLKSDTVLVTASNGNCNSLPRKQLISSFETPAQPGPIIGASTICINSQNIYKINRQSNVSNYLWTWPSNYTVVSNADSAQTIVPSSNAVSGNLSLVANNNGCTSTATSFPITINNTVPAMPSSILGGTSICKGVPKTFSIASVPNALSYKWSVPATWSIVSGQNTAQVSIQADNSVGQISVKSVNGACESVAQTLSINNVLTPPSAPLISGDINPCLNQSVVFSVSNAAGASVIWSAPTGWTITSQNQASTNILIAGTSGTISAKINNGDCEGPAASMNIVANTVPAVSEIEGEKYVKANSVRMYTVKPSLNTTYSWAVPTDWHLLSGNGTEKVAIMTGSSSGFITVYAQNNCGSSPPFNFSVYSSVSAGLDELALLGDIKVFPQPAKDHFNLSFTALQNLDQPKIVLTDMLGKTIFSRFEPNLSLGQIYEGKFSFEGLTPGIYFLQVQSSNATQTIKISINP